MQYFKNPCALPWNHMYCLDIQEGEGNVDLSFTSTLNLKFHNIPETVFDR